MTNDAIDQSECEQSIFQLYELFGRSRPIVLFCDSPWQMQMMTFLVQVLVRSRRLWNSRVEIESRATPGRAQLLWSQMNAQLTADRRALLQEHSEDIVATLRSSSGARWPERNLADQPRQPTPQLSELSAYIGMDCWRLLFDPAAEVTALESTLGSGMSQLCSPEIKEEIRKTFEPAITPGLVSVREQLLATMARTSQRELLISLREQSPLEEFGHNPPGLGPVDLLGLLTEELCLRSGTGFLVGNYLLLASRTFWWASWAVNLLPLYEAMRQVFSLDAVIDQDSLEVMQLPGLCPELATNPILASLVISCFSRKDLRQLQLLCQLARQATAYAFYEPICFVCRRPEKLSTDNRGRLHNDSGPAIKFKDGFELYSWNGTTVRQQTIQSKDSITPSMIENETNAEVRRVLIERYGAERFVSEGAELVVSDEYGTLFAKYVSGDEPIMMVRLLNSTPEPDGTYKTYFLRVPPGIKTARAAVAWTFGMRPDDYAPQVET